MLNERFSQDVERPTGADRIWKERLFAAMRAGGAAVCGLGRSNIPLIEWLYARGIRRITARDRRPPDEIGRCPILSAEGVTLLTGDGYLEGLNEAVVFRTPSLRPDTPPLAKAVAKGAILCSEAELFCRLSPARLYAVTGSDGKTTTSMLTAEMLRAAGHRVFLGGNIGDPLLPFADMMKPDDDAVLELSSFQLTGFCPHPARAAVTNLSENHLNWHKDMAEYAAAKRNICGDLTVLNADCPALSTFAPNAPRILCSATASRTELERHGLPFVFVEDRTVCACECGTVVPLFPVEALALPGRFNLENALCAAALCLDSVPPDAMEKAVRRFRGAPHRMEYIGRFRGVRCYDSSIDTTPARTAATLSAFAEKPVVIVGGRNKNLSLAPLVETLMQNARAAVLTGECAQEIYELLLAREKANATSGMASASKMAGASETAGAAVRERAGAATEAAGAAPDKTGGTGKRFTAVRAPTLEDAVRVAFRLAPPNGAILLSPGAASFDAFSDYAERGRAFASYCQRF